jgi:hypothetical protein
VHYKKTIFQFVSLSNFFLNIYILIVLIFFGNLNIAGDGFVLISLINIFTHGFSGNFRNIYLGSKNTQNINNLLLFRIKMGLIGFILTAIIFYFFISKINILFHLALILLTTTNWILELIISRYEKYNKLNIYHLINQLVFIIFFPLLVYISSDFLGHFIFIFILINVFIFNNNFNNILKKYSLLIKVKDTNFNLGVGSTLLKTISNFLWRYSALYFIGKSQSAILFLGFSFGSFYATLFDVSYGALYLKNFKKKKLLLNIFYIAYIILVLSTVLTLKKFSSLSIIELNLLYITTVYSLVGSYVMVITLQYRQNLFELKSMQKISFKADIYIYLFNSILITLLFFINEKLIVSAYLIASIFVYIVYKIILKNLFNEKI